MKMRMIRWASLCSSLIVAAIGCRPSTPNVNESTSELPASTIVIVADSAVSESDKQAMMAARESLFQQLSAALMEALTTGGPAAAITVCSQQAPEIAQAVSQQHHLLIGRTGVRLRNPNNTPPGWAAELTAAKVDTPQFVTLSNGDAAALLPIKLQAQCLLCHGPPEMIMDEVKAELARLYPLDQATGFQPDELRGWFWIQKPSGS